ncbi:hypothetical protein EDB19DRAFT_1840572, partial [Suillus lakei]
GGLTPEVTNISKYSSNILSTNLNVTEDNGPSVKTSVIFCEVFTWGSGGGWTPEVTNIRKYSNIILPTILKATEDDRPSVETPGIFYEMATEDDRPSVETPGIFCEAVGLVHLEATEDDRPSVGTQGMFCEAVSLVHLEATEDDRPSVGTQGIFCEAMGLVHLEATEDDRPSVGTPGIFCEAVGLVHLEVTEDDGPSVGTPEIFCEAVSLVHLEAIEDDRPSVETPGIFCEAVGLVHLEVTEDDGPSLGTPGIFCEAVSLVHLEHVYNDYGSAINLPGRWPYLFGKMVFDLRNGTINRTICPPSQDKRHAASSPACSQKQQRHKHDEQADVDTSTNSHDSAPKLYTHDSCGDADSSEDKDEYVRRLVHEYGTPSAISTVEDEHAMVIGWLTALLPPAPYGSRPHTIGLLACSDIDFGISLADRPCTTWEPPSHYSMNYPTFVAVENVATKTPRHGYNKEALRKNILEFILDLFMCTIPSTPITTGQSTQRKGGTHSEPPINEPLTILQTSQIQTPSAAVGAGEPHKSHMSDRTSSDLALFVFYLMLLALSLDVRGDAPSHNVLTDERDHLSKNNELPIF